MAEETSTTTTTTASAPSAPASGSYVQSLLSPALDNDLGGAPEAAQSAAPDAAADEAGTAQPGAETPQPEAEAGTLPTVDDLIQQFATEMGLNPNDPDQRKMLKRYADKEHFILKLQAENAALRKGPQPQPQATAGPQFLTDFERELAQEEESAAGLAAPQPGQPPAQPLPQPQAAPQPGPPAGPMRYGDLGDTWESPADSLQALSDAWTQKNLPVVHDIEMARLRRNFDSGIAPSLLPYVGKMIERQLNEFAEKVLGDVVPEVRRTLNQRRMVESREFAIGQLRKAGMADIDRMFEADEQAAPVIFGGQEWPSTPLNRILMQHPEIMQIDGTHMDPVKRERQAYIARLKLAHQIYKQNGIPAATAKALVDAGRNIRTAQNGDRARQAINAGSGATGVGDRQRPSSYVSQLNNLPGEIPFASLAR